MTDYISDWDIENELVTSLRNWDIFTITQRGVTTRTDTGTFSSASTHLIARNNVRNIRSLTVAATGLTFGKDYQIDYTYDDSGVTKAKIIFTAAQTGAYSIQYDYGTDKIFTDYPQEYLTVSSFPRLAICMMPCSTRPGGHGNVLETDVYFQVVVYDLSKKLIEKYQAQIRKNFIDNYTALHYLKLVQPVGKGAIINCPGELGKKKVFQKNQDFVSLFNYEIN